MTTSSDLNLSGKGIEDVGNLQLSVFSSPVAAFFTRLTSHRNPYASLAVQKNRLTGVQKSLLSQNPNLLCIYFRIPPLPGFTCFLGGKSNAVL